MIPKKTDNFWRVAMRDAYYLAATQSDDPSTQTAALIYGYDWFRKKMLESPLVVGVNEFLPGVEVTPERMDDRNLKYGFIEHAERRAIFHFFGWVLDNPKTSVLLEYFMVSPWASCTSCARAIIQSGIKILIRHKDATDMTADNWKKEIEIADIMFKETGITVIELEGNITNGTINVRFNGNIWTP